MRMTTLESLKSISNKTEKFGYQSLFKSIMLFVMDFMQPGLLTNYKRLWITFSRRNLDESNGICCKNKVRISQLESQKMDNKFLELFDRNIKGKFSYLVSHNKQMTIRTFDHIVLIDSGLNSNMFNIVYCNKDGDQRSVKAAIDYFKSKKLPYAFWIGFENDPSWLEKELLALGLVTDEIEWAMVCDLDKQQLVPIHFDFDLRQIKDLVELQDAISVLNNILPKEEHLAIQSFYEQSAAVLLSKNCSLTLFVGYENAKPISLSSLFCDQGVASIFDVIVLPEMRGKGLGKAMTLKAMLSAQEKGFNKCILTATNDAKYLYQKLGFKEVKTMKVYHEP